MATYSFTFTMEEASDPAPRLCFNLGLFDDFSQNEAQVISFDNVSLCLIDGSNVVAGGLPQGCSYR